MLPQVGRRTTSASSAAITTAITPEKRGFQSLLAPSYSGATWTGGNPFITVASTSQAWVHRSHTGHILPLWTVCQARGTFQLHKTENRRESRWTPDPHCLCANVMPVATNGLLAVGSYIYLFVYHHICSSIPLATNRQTTFLTVQCSTAHLHSNEQVPLLFGKRAHVGLPPCNQTVTHSRVGSNPWNFIRNMGEQINLSYVAT